MTYNVQQHWQESYFMIFGSKNVICKLTTTGSFQFIIFFCRLEPIKDSRTVLTETDNLTSARAGQRFQYKIFLQNTSTQF